MVHELVLKSLVIFLAATASGFASMTDAQPYDEDLWERGAPSERPESNLPPAAGRVVAVNQNTGEIVIEHRPIMHLYMEYMTMIFRVADRSMLEGLTPGDKVRFEVERDGKSYVITRIENSN
jgi:Cu/Ag efflux protein CusF